MTGAPGSPNGTPRPPALALRVAVFIASLALTLGLLELALAVVGYEYVPVDIQVGQATDARPFHVFEDSSFEYDPALIWRPRRLQSVFNSQGFRGPELSARKVPGSLRIFAIGDSNTLGWAGSEGANWPESLGRLIGRVREGAVVVNAGVWGYASYQGVVRFRETLQFDPDLVLISFGANDAHQVLQSDRDYASNPVRDSAVSRVLRQSRLGQLALAAREARSPVKSRTPQARVSLEDYRANMATIIREARARGVGVVLLTRPYVGEIPARHLWKNWGTDYNVATAEAAAQHGVPLVDVYSFFKAQDELFADESHFTAAGHTRAAAIIFDHIRPLVTAGSRSAASAAATNDRRP